MFETLAYGFLLLVVLIAFMNMANTIIISIITRKRELGVMQALGMTNSQMNSMLRNEGVLFTAGSILVSILVGMPAGYALFCYGREHEMVGNNTIGDGFLCIGTRPQVFMLTEVVCGRYSMFIGATCNIGYVSRKVRSDGQWREMRFRGRGPAGLRVDSGTGISG